VNYKFITVATLSCGYFGFSFLHCSGQALNYCQQVTVVVLFVASAVFFFPCYFEAVIYHTSVRYMIIKDISFPCIDCTILPPPIRMSVGGAISCGNHWNIYITERSKEGYSLFNMQSIRLYVLWLIETTRHEDETRAMPDSAI
jgi:hypothetical protein